jgi:hypothetical protein
MFIQRIEANTASPAVVSEAATVIRETSGMNRIKKTFT